MKHIDFIDEDMKTSVFDGVETDTILNCDHELELNTGLPSDILSCVNCGWWCLANSISKRDIDKYKIKDKRRE